MKQALSFTCALAPVLALGMLLGGCAKSTSGDIQAASTVQPPPSVPPAAKPAPAAVAEAAAPAKDTKDQIEISFPSGGTSLTPEADRKLDYAARLFRDANPVLMFTSGHADMSGDEYANLILSARRAAVVKKALVARGIPADRLLLQALGTSEPANSSGPNDPANRRVVVTWRLL